MGTSETGYNRSMATDYNYDKTSVQKSGAMGGAKGALTAAGLALAIPGVGVPLAAGIAGIGLITGAVMATRSEKKMQAAQQDAEAQAKVQADSSARAAKASEGYQQRAARQGGVVDQSDTVLLDNVGTGSQYSTWRASAFGT